ncbi:MAG TPA: cytochrome P450 [Burkholderiales bacterium]|nr:cytochrome P450 [Burkholderiales bacterium]
MQNPAAPSVCESNPDAPALRTLDELPGPRGIPLLGNALELKPKELHRLIGSWADRFGPLFVFRVATTRILTIADAETIQQVLRDRPERFRRWRRLEGIATDIKADGLFTAEGAEWKRQRKFVMHALNGGHLREFIPRLEQVVGRLRRRWWRAALAGTPIDVHVDLMRLTVDVTSGLAFGKDLNSLEEQVDPIQNHLDKIFPAVARRVTALFPYWRYLPLPADREAADAVKEIGGIIDGLIAETRARLAANSELRTRPRNLLEALIAAQEQDGEEGPRDDEIAANVMTLLLAGEDTTANSISYMVHFLMQYPRVQAAVQEEVDRVIGMADQPWQDPTTPDRLRYIEAFAHEAMRCKPVAGHVLFLEPNEDVRIRDVFVPKGTPILALSAHLGTQEENFAQPQEFRPERWLKGAEHHDGAHNAKAFMPFGAAPRTCPGRQLAMLQIKMVMAMLCRDFEISAPEDASPMEDIYNFTVGPVHVYATLRPRGTVRRGIDIELRVGERRVVIHPIPFSDRRVSDRRQARARAVELRVGERRGEIRPIPFPDRRFADRRRQGARTAA